jgi:hypothetical protein
MLINNKAAKSVRANSLKKIMLLITFSILPLTYVTASELKVLPASVSQGALKHNITESQRKKIIATNKLAELSDQVSGKANAHIRGSTLNNQAKSTAQAKSGEAIQKVSNHYDQQFTIYSAASFLQEDYDRDGYYQTFSVTFDADVYSYSENHLAEVYALLYLSKNGGPWQHYFTTDNFLIEGDTDADEYEVISTFMSGYESDHYDVLIDLYQVGYQGIAASYSSDDSNALYALPLESAEYDQAYTEVIEVIEVVEIRQTHGGSLFSLLLVLLSGLLMRVKRH